MAQFRAFWWHLNHILELYVTFWHFFLLTILVFSAFYAVLLRTRSVVICALFWVKYFLLKPCWCEKNCLFCMSGEQGQARNARVFSAQPTFPVSPSGSNTDCRPSTSSRPWSAGEGGMEGGRGSWEWKKV